MPDAEDELAGRPNQETAFPTTCYLCGKRNLGLRFAERRSPDHASEFYSCTSFGHGQHPPIWRCLSCGLLFQWPVPDPDDLLKAYSAVEDPVYVGERVNRYFTFRKALARLGPPRSRRLLDIGAYCGYFVDVACQGGFRAEGTELSSWAVAQGRELGLTMHNDTVSDRAASGDRYDVVTMWDVVEHLEDPRAELIAAHGLLEPGGELHVSTIDAGSWVARVMGRRWPWLMDMHLFYFDRRNIGSLLEQAGFRVDAVRNYTHVVSLDYLLSKVGAVLPAVDPVAEAIRTVIPERWRVPVNLGDNMHVVARR
ncbi:MAG: class I SAM-dependent methyltransferase, partial [Acidimicrobiia bacterium]|nr:class I SAM-dependent methyltransferase [Acidimicrobiia bacterium]